MKRGTVKRDPVMYTGGQLREQEESIALRQVIPLEPARRDRRNDRRAFVVALGCACAGVLVFFAVLGYVVGLSFAVTP